MGSRRRRACRPLRQGPAAAAAPARAFGHLPAPGGRSAVCAGRHALDPKIPIGAGRRGFCVSSASASCACLSFTCALPVVVFDGRPLPRLILSTSSLVPAAFFLVDSAESLESLESLKSLMPAPIIVCASPVVLDNLSLLDARLLADRKEERHCLSHKRQWKHTRQRQCLTTASRGWTSARRRPQLMLVWVPLAAAAAAWAFWVAALLSAPPWEPL